MNETSDEPSDEAPQERVESEVTEEGSAAEAEAAVEADLGSLERERDELRDLAQRVQADFENYRKRMLREQTEKIERANEHLVGQLLPVLDSFELALANVAESDDRARKGVELVFNELMSVLEKAGLERIETDGTPFDPNVHEAVMQEDGDSEPVVDATMRAGYALKGRVVRPAMVKVTRSAGSHATGS